MTRSSTTSAPLLQRRSLPGAANADARHLRAMLALVRDPPVSVGELAAALGLRIEALVPHGMFSMGSILGPGVSAEYEWDMYHEAPVETLGALARRRLVSYRVSGPDAELEAELRARYGEGAAGAPADTRDVPRRYGPFALSPDALEWHATWPVPPGDPAAVVALIDAASEPGPLALEAPVPAVALAAALGHPGAVARTVDVHMSSWQIEPLTYGEWEVDAALERAPSGPPLPSPPATATRALDPEVLVHGVTLRCASI